MREMMLMPWLARYIELLIEVKAKLPEMTGLSAGDIADQLHCMRYKSPKNLWQIDRPVVRSNLCR